MTNVYTLFIHKANKNYGHDKEIIGVHRDLEVAKCSVSITGLCWKLIENTPTILELSVEEWSEYKPDYYTIEVHELK